MGGPAGEWLAIQPVEGAASSDAAVASHLSHSLWRCDGQARWTSHSGRLVMAVGLPWQGSGFESWAGFPHDTGSGMTTTVCDWLVVVVMLVIGMRSLL